MSRDENTYRLPSELLADSKGQICHNEGIQQLREDCTSSSTQPQQLPASSSLDDSEKPDVAQVADNVGAQGGHVEQL